MKTATISSLGIVNPAFLAILIHFHQDNPNATVLGAMELNIYSPTGGGGVPVLSFSLGGPASFPTPVDSTDIPRGTLFRLDNTSIGVLQNFLSTTTNAQNYRIGLKAAFTVSGDGTDDQFFVGNLTPEPATYGMVGLALVGLGALKYRRRKT